MNDLGNLYRDCHKKVLVGETIGRLLRLEDRHVHVGDGQSTTTRHHHRDRDRQRRSPPIDVTHDDVRFLQSSSLDYQLI